MKKFSMQSMMRDHAYGYSTDYLIENHGEELMLRVCSYFQDVREADWKKTLSDGRVIIFTNAMSQFASSALNVEV